jgi:hypothetical protein
MNINRKVMDQVNRINTIKTNKTITDRVTKKYLIEKNIEFFMASANSQDEPWNLKYFGVGNKNWG